MNYNNSADNKVNWIDTGCKLSPSCLACPFPVCIEDDPTWFTRNKRRLFNASVLDAVAIEGMTVESAAVMFKVTERTIYRAMVKARKEPNLG